MTTLSDLLDSYVKSLKETKRFEKVKFVFSGKVRPAEFPLLNFIVATSVAGISMENPSADESIRRVTLHFDIYGHKDASKRDVNLMCLELCEELSKVVSKENAKILETSEAVYDSNLCVWRQQIRIKLRYSREAVTNQDFKVYLDGRLLELSGFEETEEYALHPVKEFLSGVTSYIDAGDFKRYILVSVKGEENPFVKNDFDLFEGIKGVLYRGCRVIKMTAECKDGQEKIWRYTLDFSEKIYAEEDDGK